MQEILGKFEVEPEHKSEYMALSFSPNALSLEQRWQNNGLSADFLGDYLSNFFPQMGDDPATTERQAEIRSAVSYIANELLENAMKHCKKNVPNPIRLALYLRPDHMRFYLNNTVSAEVTADFKQFIRELEQSDPQQMYLQQVRNNQQENDQNVSRLGFLTMLNDYQVELGWCFNAEENSPLVEVATTVKLNTP